MLYGLSRKRWRLIFISRAYHVLWHFRGCFEILSPQEADPRNTKSRDTVPGKLPRSASRKSLLKSHSPMSPCSMLLKRVARPPAAMMCRPVSTPFSHDHPIVSDSPRFGLGGLRASASQAGQFIIPCDRSQTPSLLAR